MHRGDGVVFAAAAAAAVESAIGVGIAGTGIGGAAACMEGWLGPRPYRLAALPVSGGLIETWLIIKVFSPFREKGLLASSIRRGL